MIFGVSHLHLLDHRPGVQKIDSSIATLADHPRLIPVLAEWFHAQWGSLGESLGCRRLYLYSPTAGPLYTELGWQLLERTIYAGEAVDVLCFDLEQLSRAGLPLCSG